MFQRSLVIFLLLVGSFCLGYGAMTYDPRNSGGDLTWFIALVGGGILTPASILHLTGIAYSETGFSLRDNWSGRLLGDLSRNDKNPDAQLVHCELYASGLVAGVVGVFMLIAIVCGVLGIHSFVTTWNTSSTPSTPVEWGVFGLAVGYLLLGLAGLAVVGVTLAYIAKSLSSFFGWKEENAFTTIAILAVFGALVFMVASTSNGSIGIWEAAWAVIRLCVWGVSVGLFLLICVGLIASPLWMHIAIKKFFPNLYQRICPVVRDTLRTKRNGVRTS